MRRVMTTIMAIIMVGVMSVTAYAKTQNDKYDELSAYYLETFDKGVKEEVVGEFGEAVIDNKEVVCWAERERIDVGVYKYIVNLQFDGEDGDLFQIVGIIDFFDCKTIKDVDDEYFEELGHWNLFNGRRVSDDFFNDYIYEFENELVSAN